ncbi:lytic transglycosylase F [Vibrio hannami]|uniref:transglycosylase SLT domain-containing protein n=1 Tax=Vibrio hannami TaxID=2717094 RepID=UPI00240FF116|nr:lytic transglycosylase F [Vibrio hannami]MDG3087189.1 lytic transglycosylase F [Vibrio hannami]
MKKLCHWLIIFWFYSFNALSLELSPLTNEPYTGDFDVLEKNGGIRVLVSADLGFYYIEGGKPKGMLAELLYHFEKQLKQKSSYLHLQIIPVERSELIPSLISGHGDLIVANLTITPQRERDIDFSTPMLTGVNEYIVTRKDEPEITTLEQLSGKEIWIRASSSYFEHISKINRLLSETGFPPMNVHFLEEALQDYEVIDMVNQGHIYSTVLDSHKTELWLRVMDNIKVHKKVPLHFEGKIAWAFRKGSPMLEKIVNNYLKTAKSGTLLGNVLYEKYIEKTGWLSRALNPAKVEKMHALSDLFKKYGEEYEFDWLMLSAQAFQESGFDNRKVSHKGAVGIMQVLPSTANDPKVNIPDINNLENNIHAGTKYLRFLQDRYFSDESITEKNKVYLSLAAYNAGPGNIRKMRRLAEKNGYDPNVWFRNVEIVTRRNIGREPVHYVANINRYFVIYKQMAELNQLREEQNAALVNLVLPGAE